MAEEKIHGTCTRCGMDTIPSEICQACGYVFRFNCQRCRSKRVNLEPHPCDVSLDGVSERELDQERRPSPPPSGEAGLGGPGAPYGELLFAADGTYKGVKRNPPGVEVDVGSAFLEALERRFLEGLIDQDTMVTMPGRPRWITAGELLRERGSR